MELDYMENLAREYNKALNGNSDTSLLENSRDIVINQLDILNNIARTNNTTALRYLFSLKQKSLSLLNALIKEEVVPMPRNSQAPQNRLVNYQIELFTNLDTLKKHGVLVQDILELENRAMSFIAYLC